MKKNIKIPKEVFENIYLSKNSLIEIEDGEYIQNSETGEIQEAVGEKHDNGGIKTNLPDKSRVISDYTKIGKDNAKKFKEQFDVKVRATDTFATVLDKVNKNIGLDKLIEEEKIIYEKIKEQEKDKSLKENVKKLNLTALQKNLHEISESKEELKTKQKEAFDSIFEEQEKIPKEGDKDVMKEGGMMNSDLEYLSKKYKLDKNKLMDLIEMQGGGYTNRTRLKDWEKEARRLGYDGDFNMDSSDLGTEVGKLQKFFAENYPDQVVKYFKNQPINAKGIEILKKQNPDVFKKTGISKSKKSADYTNEERLKLQEEYRQQNPDNTDFWLEQFQDNTWNENNVDTWRTITMPLELDRPSDITPMADMSIRGLENTQQPDQKPIDTTTNYDITQQNQNRPNNPNNYASNIPLIPQDFILPPSARQPVYKQSVQMGRIDPVKVSAEPNLVEIERQRQALDEATRFLPPMQRAAMMANALGQTQTATNQAISQTEAMNAQAQYNADLYNLQTRTKEDLMNIRFEQDYENKTMAAIGNQELDVRNYFNDLNNQNRYNFEYIDRRNLLNQAYPQFNVQGSSNIEFAGAPDFNVTQYFNPSNKPISEMTDEEYELYRQSSLK